MIDAADFLRDPEAYLRWLCDYAGVEFTAAMLPWPAGPRASDGVWAPHWYDAVLRSTGFEPYRPRQVELDAGGRGGRRGHPTGVRAALRRAAGALSRSSADGPSPASQASSARATSTCASTPRTTSPGAIRMWSASGISSTVRLAHRRGHVRPRCPRGRRRCRRPAAAGAGWPRSPSTSTGTSQERGQPDRRQPALGGQRRGVGARATCRPPGPAGRGQRPGRPARAPRQRSARRSRVVGGSHQRCSTRQPCWSRAKPAKNSSGAWGG